MRFRTSMQTPRRGNSNQPDRPATATQWKFPNLREKASGLARRQSAVEETTKTDDPPGASVSPVAQDRQTSKASTNEATANDAPKREGQPQMTAAKKRTMQDFMQKTGAHLRTQSASLKARGAKLSEGMRGNKKSKVVKTSPKRDSQRNSQVNMKYTSDNDMIEKILSAQPREKQASADFLSKQRDKVQVRKPSSSVSPLESQAEQDRKPVGADEVLTMFTGAPYFGVEERHGTYAPQVSFKGGDLVKCARYSTDYEKLDVRSFGACTLGQHRTRQLEGKPPPCVHETEASKEETRLLEVPSMLAACGREPGTVGFEHYLQIPISDSLSTVGQPPDAAKLKMIRSDPEQLGLRRLDMEDLIKRLNELNALHAFEQESTGGPEDFWNEDKIDEMGEDLFESVLSAEAGAPGADAGPVSLKDQILALQNVLDKKDLWHDFSVVEWRIRVGQLLWASDDTEKPSERNMLLLQITLAAELLIRIHAVESIPAVYSSVEPIISAEDVEVIESKRSTKVQWDILLAERFLENLSISAQRPSEEDKRKLNRSSLWSAITFLTARESPDDESSVQPILSPKDDLKQIDGLVNFAEAIGWPHAKDIRREMELKLSSTSDATATPRPVSFAGSVYATPLSSPMFPMTPGARSSFFGLCQQPPRPGLTRNTTAQSVQLLPSRNTTGLNAQEVFEVGGWLSRSWLSGLVLPGEPASHFLISTLLEHSSQAITALGAEANLYGGFFYEGRSFWSKSCIVGRVLAATKGSTECMGWISIPELEAEEELEDGWIKVNVEDAPGFTAAAARIKDTASIGHDSDPLRGHDLVNLQAGDFTIPADGNPVMGNNVKSHGLSLTSPARPAPAAVTESSLPMGGISVAEEPSDASIIFSSPTNSKMARISVPLTYDVHFVSSYPCHPKARTPTKPVTPSPRLSFEQDRANDAQPVDSTRPSKTDSVPNLRTSHIEKELPPLPAQPAHPLHIDYHFDIVPVATLLSTPAERRSRALSSPREREAAVSDGAANDALLKPMNDGVVVLDCRGPDDLELLARAWCAKVGENALVGQSGRTCLACCVREAKALDISIIIRT